MSQSMSSKTFSTYEKALERLYQIGVFRRERKDTDQVVKLHSALGNPARNFPSIQVAGTNGKSSVSKKIAAGLQQSGLKVGLFTSPHLISLCERISINDVMIEKEEVVTRLQALFDLAKDLRPSFFDYLTVLSAQYFAENEVDVAVYEVGLGGLKDATNIISPILSVITSISFDHKAQLGNTLEEIAQEKAGIIRPGVPVVLGPNARYDAILDTANALSSYVMAMEPADEHYEMENRSIAKKALTVLRKHYPLTDEQIDNGVRVTPPCRFQEVPYEGKILLFDVAHNPDALKHLIKGIDLRYPRKEVQFIFGMAHDKAHRDCIEVIKAKGKGIHLPKVDHGRLADPKVLYPFFEGHDNTHLYDSVSLALQAALKTDDLIVVCGSVYIMESVLESTSSTVSLSGYDPSCMP